MTIEQAKQTITNSTLPADIKAQALENLRLYPSGNNGLTGNPISHAIDMFTWGFTPQGTLFWYGIYNHAKRGKFDPPAQKTSGRFTFRDDVKKLFPNGDPKPFAKPAEESVDEIEKNNRRKLLLDFMAFIGRTYSPTEFWKVGMEDVINEFEKRIQSLENKKP